jgi:Uma2 family endonuclease
MTVAQPFVLESLPINLSTLKLTDEQFSQLCLSNPELSFELTAAGVLVIMVPVGGESGKREASLITDLSIWNRQTRLGEVFSSSTIFILPNGAKRSPDAAWVELSRWNDLSSKEQGKYPPLAPDFVIELRSLTDSLSELQEKMLEYMANGVQLGFLINPQDQRVEIYRIDRSVEILQSPAIVSGEQVLPGFTLDLNSIW